MSRADVATPPLLPTRTPAQTGRGYAVSAEQHVREKYFNEIPDPKPDPRIRQHPVHSLASALIGLNLERIIPIKKGEKLAITYEFLKCDLKPYNCNSITEFLKLLNGPNAHLLEPNHEDLCIISLLGIAKSKSQINAEYLSGRLEHYIPIIFKKYQGIAFTDQLSEILSPDDDEETLITNLKELAQDKKNISTLFDTLIAHEQFGLIAEAYLALKSKDELSKLECCMLDLLKSDTVNDYMQRFLHPTLPGHVTRTEKKNKFTPALFLTPQPRKSGPKESTQLAFLDQADLYSHNERSNLDILAGHYLSRQIETICEMAFMLQQAQVDIRQKSLKRACYYINRARAQFSNMPSKLKDKLPAAPEILTNKSNVTEENIIGFATAEIESFTITALELALEELKTPLTLHDPYAYYMQASLLHVKAVMAELTTPSVEEDIFKTLFETNKMLNEKLASAKSCIKHNPSLGHMLESLALYDIYNFLEKAESLEINYTELFKQYPELNSSALYEFINTARNERNIKKIQSIGSIATTLNYAIENRAKHEGSELNGIYHQTKTRTGEIHYGFKASHLAHIYDVSSLYAFQRQLEALHTKLTTKQQKALQSPSCHH